MIELTTQMPDMSNQQQATIAELESLLQSLAPPPAALIRTHQWQAPPSQDPNIGEDPQWVQCDLLHEMRNEIRTLHSYMDRVIRITQATNHCVRDMLQEVKQIRDNTSNTYSPSHPIISTSSPTH